MTDLYARYERLLFAYPRDWRRHRGPEIAATYTEMAADGQRWPRGRDAASLLRHGLRTRLGRPGSRLVVPLTVLAMLIGGLCAAAAGARAGWGASTGLNTRQVAAANRLGPAPQSQLSRTPTTTANRAGTPAGFTGYLAMPAWDTPMTVVESPLGVAIGEPTPTAPGPTPRELVDQEWTRLAGSGWTITGQAVTDSGATMTVRRGDLVARLDTSSQTTAFVYTIVMGDPGSHYWTNGACKAKVGGAYTSGPTTQGPVAPHWTYPGSPYCVGPAAFTLGPKGFAEFMYRTTPANVPVFAVLAGLLGAVLTYLLIGWLNRRASRLALIRRRVVTAGLALTVALAAPAAAVCGAGVWTALRHHSDVPIRYWGGFVTGDVRIAALAAAILLVATIAGATLARPTWWEAEIAL